MVDCPDCPQLHRLFLLGMQRWLKVIAGARKYLPARVGGGGRRAWKTGKQPSPPLGMSIHSQPWIYIIVTISNINIEKLNCPLLKWAYFTIQFPPSRVQWWWHFWECLQQSTTLVCLRPSEPQFQQQNRKPNKYIVCFCPSSWRGSFNLNALWVEQLSETINKRIHEQGRPQPLDLRIDFLSNLPIPHHM